MENALNQIGKNLFGVLLFCIEYAFVKAILDTSFSLNAVVAIVLVSLLGIRARLGRILDKMSEKE
jgi:hypothetical protein